MTSDNKPSRRGDEKFFGRRAGPALRPRHRRLLEHLLPVLRIPDDPAALSKPATLFPSLCSEVWLEIGFGGGEHLAWQAARNPQVGLIGAEPFVNGVAKLLAAIDTQDLRNVRIIDDDIRPVLDRFGAATVSRAFLLFPDPWPKTRHHKRRFVNQVNLARLHRILKPGGEFRFASDIDDYVRWTLMHMHRHGGFRWLAETPADWRGRPPDWPPTRYEQKALRQGRNCTYLRFRRI